MGKGCHHLLTDCYLLWSHPYRLYCWYNLFPEVRTVVKSNDWSLSERVELPLNPSFILSQSCFLFSLLSHTTNFFFFFLHQSDNGPPVSTQRSLFLCTCLLQARVIGMERGRDILISKKWDHKASGSCPPTSLKLSWIMLETEEDVY